ncbi:MAG: PrgI family protein [Candidatus Magasanikbacteria bacterium]|jgi:hypothetical protein|nr:PrgI family protein [Candidatus Magasanikbacteria bacterium]
MQQFVVPQFIDVEDKIFGPITTRQFLILLVASGVVFLAYRFADLVLFAVILALVGGGAIVMAFVKINGQAFHYFLLNIAQTIKTPNRRIWYNTYTDKELNMFRMWGIAEEQEVVVKQKAVRREHIRNLSLQVNTGGYFKADDEEEPTVHIP